MKTNKVAFLHLRYVSEKGVEPKGGLTIAYKLVDYDEDRYTVEYEAACCSPNDHYNRRRGNLIASGRLAKVGGWTAIVSKDNWFEELEVSIASHMNKEIHLVNTSTFKDKIG